MGGICGSKVYVEANFTLLNVEANHPAVGEKVGSFTHCENREATQDLRGSYLAPGLVMAQEEDVASLETLRLALQMDAEYAGSNELTIDSG